MKILHLEKCILWFPILMSGMLRSQCRQRKKLFRLVTTPASERCRIMMRIAELIERKGLSISLH